MAIWIKSGGEWTVATSGNEADIKKAQADATQALADAKKANDALPSKADAKTVEDNFKKTVTNVGVANGTDTPKIQVTLGSETVPANYPIPVVSASSAGVVTKSMWDAKADDTKFSDFVPRDIADTMLSTLTVSLSADKVELVSDKITLADGSSVQFRAPIAPVDASNAGVLLPADYQTISQNKTDIEALKGRSIRYVVKLSTTSPSQEQLTEAYNAIVPTPPSEKIDGTTLVDITNNKEYTWFTSEGKWVDRGTTVVDIATNDKVGIVKGTNNVAGKIFVETDGGMSVFGWDAVVTDVSNLTSKIDAHIATKSGNPHNVTAAEVGLGNVDNTSDADKPISTATNSALEGKVPITRKVAGKALNADVTLVKGDVGLGNVDNTSDANKPISTATQDALDGKLKATWPTTLNGQYLKINTDGSITTGVPPAPSAPAWGLITGTLADQTDLQNALNAKATTETVNALSSKVDKIETTANNALPKSGGAMTGYLTDGASGQVRNITIKKADPQNSEGNDGDVWITY